ncbi:MAG: hypothetical protein ACRCUP_04810 [Mycoplasmatales bacterium]
MKKIFSLLLVTVFVLAGCTAGASTPGYATDSTMDSKMDSTTDSTSTGTGNYQGEVTMTDQSGNVNLTTITYMKMGDDVTNVKFGGTRYGVDKSDAEQYRLVQDGNGKANWSDQAAMVAKVIEENDGVDKINVNGAGKDADAITGATINITEFVEAFKAAQEVK